MKKTKKRWYFQAKRNTQFGIVGEDNEVAVRQMTQIGEMPVEARGGVHRETGVHAGRL